MSDLYTTSLDIMDEHLDSISDEEFLHQYLSVEEFQGPLAKDFLSYYSFFGNEYAVNSELFGNEYIFKREILIKSKLDADYPVSGIVDFRVQSKIQRIQSKPAHSTNFDSSYGANDDFYMLVA